MKLEVGKKYTVSGRNYIKWVRIDAVREELAGKNGYYAITEALMDGGFTFDSWEASEQQRISGEYKTPMPKLTKDDIGKKVLLRNGQIKVIIGYRATADEPFETSDYWYCANGRIDIDQNGEDASDIIEVLS